jgi:excisionase family DNA binding protein
MNDLNREVFTPAELAPVIGRSRSWVEERVKDGRLPAIRDGGRWLLRRSDLIRAGWLTPPCTHEKAPAATGAVDAR